MGTAQLLFAVERCGGATGSHVTESDVTRSDINQVPCPEVCSAHAQPEVTKST